MHGGWTEVIDGATGRFYYFNRKTNASRWDRPAELRPEPDLQNWVRTNLIA
jgi:hypothetical protein